MLYHLLAPLAKQHILFNLFNYITFRAAGATVTALVVAFLWAPGIIRRLRERHVGQVIRAEGPASHHTKRGTPTMGGLVIILATVVPTLLWARLDSRYVVVAVAAMLWTGAIGFVDDYLKIVRGKSQGLVARWKLVGQISFGVALGAGTFAVFAYVFGRADWTRYLLVYFLPGSQELTIFCGALAGAALGFLWFNAHPAQVFMGDTGSLAIGGALGTVAIMLKAEFLLLIAGGVFVAEAISVLLQTGVYRWHKRRRGKEYADAHRVFRMAPLHHHFEKLGWAEPQVVMRFYILGVLCAAIALATLKVR